MDIVYIIKILWRRKWWLIIIPAISAGGAYFFSLSLVNQYKASTQIATGFTTNEAIRVSDERASPRDIELNFNNVLTSMNSGICNNLISYRLVLHDIDSTKSAFRQISKDEKFNITEDDLNLSKSEFRKKLNDLQLLTIDDLNSEILLKTLDAFGYNYQFVKGGLKIYRVPNTDFIQIEFVSENPALSAYAVNAFCEEFLRYYRGQREEGSSISVSFFKQLVEQKKSEMDEKSESLKMFKATNSFVNSGEEGNSKLLQISELETQQSTIESNIYGFNLSLKRFRNELNALEGGNSSIGSTGTNSRVLFLRNRINSLNEKYITSGSNNSVLLDSLNLLRNQLKIEMANLSQGSGKLSGLTKSELVNRINDLEIEIAIEESKLSSISSKLRNLRGSISGYVSKEGVVSSLQAEVDVATKEYLEAVNRFNEANNKLLASTGTIRQLYKASAPGYPISNKKVLLIAAAGFASLFFCIFVFVVIELMDSKLRTVGIFKRVVQLELAEQLIKVNTQTLNFNTLFESKSNVLEMEMFKEYVRKLRFQIELTNSKVFLITSCKKGEGKTFIIYTLAYVLSLVNKKILIIDTNFKNNGLTKWLSIKKGEIRLLEGYKDHEVKLLTKGQFAQKDFDQGENNIYDLVSPTPFKNIFIIGNNGGYESPEEILSGRSFDQLIRAVSVDYDYVFLEGAALNDYSDSKELAKYVEKVIPVFSAETSFGQLDRESIIYLKSLKERLAGGILNKVNIKDLEL